MHDAPRLDEQGLRAALRALGMGLEVHERCDSTNRIAEEAAKQGAEPLVVVAEFQTGGRGRLGRTWDSEPGANLLFSMLMRPQIPATDAAQAVLCWVAAMAEELDVLVKWPNDLVSSDGEKLGGVLSRLDVSAAGLNWLVVGVGINVNQLAFEIPGATSLAALRGHPLDRTDLLIRLVRAVHAQPAGTGLDLWRRRSHTLGRRVRVGDREGIATDVRDDGALVLGAGEVVLAGDVVLVETTDSG